VRRLCVDVMKNFITAASSKQGEFVTSTTTARHLLKLQPHPRQ
jgi:hypothetical protein